MKRFALTLMVIVVVFVVVWWLAFATFSPCDAMRAEAVRVADVAGGSDGRAIRDALVGDHARAMSSVECVQTAVSLKVRGKDAVILLRR